MFVAVCDQSTGTSTSRCSKMTEPLSLPIEAVRVYHWTSSYGVLPASSLAVKCRGNAIPVRVFLVDLVFNNSIFALKSTEICPIAVFSFGNPTDCCLRNGAPIYGVASRSLSICSVLELRKVRHKHYRSVTAIAVPPLQSGSATLPGPSESAGSATHSASAPACAPPGSCCRRRAAALRG